MRSSFFRWVCFVKEDNRIECNKETDTVLYNDTSVIEKISNTGEYIKEMSFRESLYGLATNEKTLLVRGLIELPTECAYIALFDHNLDQMWEIEDPSYQHAYRAGDNSYFCILKNYGDATSEDREQLMIVDSRGEIGTTTPLLTDQSYITDLFLIDDGLLIFGSVMYNELSRACMMLVNIDNQWK